MRARGRPVLGAISGLFFGLFLGLMLFSFKLYQSDSPVLWIMPLAGLVLGIVLAFWAPFGRGKLKERGEVVEEG